LNHNAVLITRNLLIFHGAQNAPDSQSAPSTQLSHTRGKGGLSTAFPLLRRIRRDKAPDFRFADAERLIRPFPSIRPHEHHPRFEHPVSVHANRWNIEIERPTTGSMVAERTAAVIWSMLAPVTSNVFLWNVFPFHPHSPGQPFTNRRHDRFERGIGEEILAELIGMLQPRIEILDKELDVILRLRRRKSARLSESPCG